MKHGSAPSLKQMDRFRLAVNRPALLGDRYLITAIQWG